MKRLITAIVLAAALAAPASAQATTIIAPVPAHSPYQRWADEAKMPTPEVTLTVVEEPCPLPPGQFAWACTVEGAYTIYDAEYERETFLHELGHNFDFYVMPQRSRERFSSLVHDEREWWLQPRGPAELFAAIYARCAVTGIHFFPRAHGDTTLFLAGRWIAPESYRRMCRLIARSG